MPAAPPTGTPDPSLAGLGRFAGKVALGTAIAIGIAFAGLKLMPPGPRDERASASGARPAASPPESEGRGAPRATSSAGSIPAEEGARAPLTKGDIAREVERRYAAGELSEAQRRFDACPGGDQRRLAWLDAEGHVLKLRRDTAAGHAVEEWFDGSGRLREAVVSAGAPGRSATRHVVLDERGQERVVDAGDGAHPPDAPWPRLVRGEPAKAFFSGAGCDGGR